MSERNDHYLYVRNDGTVEDIPFDIKSFDYSKNKTYAEMLMEAARVTGMSPFVMAATIMQEFDEIGSSPLITGEGLNGKYKGIYNFINYQAYMEDSMEARERGLWWANGEDAGLTNYGRPWDSPEKSIFRGMAILAANFLYNGQENYYFKKFNVNPASWATGEEYWYVENNSFITEHQYMSYVGAANSEAMYLGNFFISSGFSDRYLVFYIPVYQNMPKYPSPVPGNEAVCVQEYNKDFTGDSTAERIINDFGEYPCYKDLLLPLHEKHPNWTFIKVEVPAFYDNIDTTWDGIMAGETKAGVNLIFNDSESAWIKGTKIRDSGGWVDASDAAVAYYLDPRNFLIDNGSVYQFLYHGYDKVKDKYINEANVNKMVSGTFLANTVVRYKDISK